MGGELTTPRLPKMKKYHLFAGYDYYPCGFDDYKGSYELLDDAVMAGSTWVNTEWYDVLAAGVDGSLELVASGRHSGKR